MSNYLRNMLINCEGESIVPLTFMAESAGATVKLTKNGSPTVDGVQYRVGTSGGWTPYTIDTVLTLTNVGDCVQFQNSLETLGTTTNDYAKFVLTGQIAASGNLMSMVNYSDVVPSYGFKRLFDHCSSLTAAPDIIASVVSNNGCENMFDSCSSLRYPPLLPAKEIESAAYLSMFWNAGLYTAPELPATTLANNCYEHMFYGCESLTTAPELPATTLAEKCYRYLFYKCYSLTSAPELPATTLANNCYEYMFCRCTGLKSAPELPATTLASECYAYMFDNCTSLTSPPELPATTLARFCYNRMFNKCTSLISAPELPATTLATYCYSYMFLNCTKLSAIKVGFTEWHSTATDNWVKNVFSTGTFDAPRELPIVYGTSRIPTNWDLPGHTYIILVKDQSINQNFEDEVNYTIQYTLYPETLKPTFTIIDGTLPEGLTLDSSTGIITGTSSTAFEGDLTIQLSAEGCESVTMVLSLKLYEAGGLPQDYIFYVDGTNISQANTRQQMTVYGSNGTIEASSFNGIPALYFNGTKCLIGSDAGFPSGNNNRTVSMLVAKAADSGYSLFSWGTNINNQSYQIVSTVGGKLRISGSNSAANESESSSGVDAVGKWVHYLILRKDGVTYFYINGVNYGSFTYERNTTINNTFFIIGGGTDYGLITSNRFNGYITNIKVYNRALEEDEITALANEYEI